MAFSSYPVVMGFDADFVWHADFSFLDEESFESDWDMTHIVRYKTLRLFFERLGCTVLRLEAGCLALEIAKPAG